LGYAGVAAIVPVADRRRSSRHLAGWSAVPEGHTIHRIARDQNADLAGHRIAASAVQARFAAGAARLDGHVFEHAEAWGKHLFQWWEDLPEVLHVHLGLIGKWTRRASPPPLPVGEVRLRLEGPAHTWDLSGPMACALITPDEHDHIVAGLGPDPLRRDADPERFVTNVGSSRRAIGALLMDQDVVAGIGNVYRAELLNIVGIDPRREGRALTRDEVDRLWAETVRQLRLGVKRNKIVTMRTDELVRPVSRLRRGEGRYVYHQEACGRCGTPVVDHRIGGRRISSCPTCQPA